MYEDGDRWRRMTEIFQEALERPPVEREIFLEQACGEDRELRRAVASLLEADREAGDYMEEPLMRLSERLSKPSSKKTTPR